MILYPKLLKRILHTTANTNINTDQRCPNYAVLCASVDADAVGDQLAREPLVVLGVTQPFCYPVIRLSFQTPNVCFRTSV